MEHQVPENKRKGRPPPKRGQVMARILGGLVHAVIPKAFKNGEKNPKQDGDRSSADATPTLSGYSSSFEDG
ncbi:hypothetical protein BHE74_00034827 [Ensete ventricosum]|uniref:Uncharacterized protein n=1 Tax=Ensete ventricosum TaxID=4639 RepID=A0A426ZJQ4_ENSVE|nr:hypothetical protein B296_00020875 [Ensete ventricosum]RWW58342.1 hypothetical protein BHE74_00034827 [Ensete ventricosum]RZS20113.1 hypothetical protein BHM03_00052603 [Ensete ventricosum]